MSRFSTLRVAGIGLALLASASLSARAATYYIDPSAAVPGNGTIESPYQSWLGVPIKGGNSYLQRRGTTYVGTVGVLINGTSNLQIRIGTYGDGPPPIIDGQILLQTAAHVIIDGFDVRNSIGSGVQILTRCRHIELRGLRISHCAGGVAISEDAGANNLIEDCTIFENDSTGIAISGGTTALGSETIIRNNTIYRNGLHGVQIKGNYYIVEGNEIHNNGLNGIPGTSAVHIYSPGPDEPFGDNNIIRDNRISNQNDFDGFDGNGVQADHFSDGNEITNNEIFHNDGGGVFIHDSAECLVRDNVLYGNARDRGKTRPEPGEMNITSKSVEINRAENNSVLDNVIVAVNPAALAIYVDSEASEKTNTFGGNALFHESGGLLWRVSEELGSDMALWNEFAIGGGDDFVLDPVAAGFTPPVPPPAFMLDHTFVVHSPVFTTVDPSQTNILLGSPDPDTFVGADFDDTLVGNGSDDHLTGGLGADWLVGGFGNDTLIGEDGNDFVLGGYDDDFIDSGNDHDDISAGSGDDTIMCGPGNDRAIGGPGDDDMDGEQGNDALTGGPGDDFITGGEGNDLLFGNEGDDVLDDSSDADGNNSLFGYEGNDLLKGGGGGDQLVGGPGLDTLYGGDGLDYLDDSDDDLPSFLYGEGGGDFIFGGRGADELDGGPGNDVLDAGAGDDLVDGGEGDDFLAGAMGSDRLDGGPGDDIINEASDDSSENAIYGGPGDDVIVTSALGGLVVPGDGNDVVSGGIGPDVIDERDDPSGENLLDGGDGGDQIFGGAGEDQIEGGKGDDEIDAGPAADKVDGGDGDDTLVGGEGLDLIEGGAGNDTIDESDDSGAANLLFGDEGDDLLTGGAGSDQMYGNEGEDTLDGGLGSDVMFGGADSDIMRGGLGNDFFYGGGGNDDIDGGDGNDVASGGYGDDTMDTGEGDDALDGESGIDELTGGAGSDILVGGSGNDLMHGGPGVDYFTFNTNSGHDIITDFAIEDVLVTAEGPNGEDIVTSDDLFARMRDTAEGLLLELGGGNDVLLQGIELAAIVAEDNLIVRESEVEPAVRLLGVPASIAAISNTSLFLPISIDDATGLTSFSFELRFDPEIFDYVGFSKGALLANWDELTVSVDGDTLRIESAGSDPLAGSGALVEVELHVHEKPPHLVSLFNLTHAELNSATLPVEHRDGIVVVVDRVLVDVNKDEAVDASDVQLVVNAVLGTEVPEGVDPDVDGNGAYDAVDLQLVINAVASVAGK